MKALLLLSGGYDSAVAGYIIQKKGLEIIAVHFSYEPLTDNSPELKSRKISEMLKFKKFISINISKECETIADKCRRDLYFVLAKRLMLRKAAETAKKEGCEFLITGEALGQVGSQTLSNLRTITEVSKIPVLRPLLAYDKEAIIRLARQIGTYEVSSGPEVCDILGPKHPATRSKIEDARKEELKLKSQD